MAIRPLTSAKRVSPAALCQARTSDPAGEERPRSRPYGSHLTSWTSTPGGNSPTSFAPTSSSSRLRVALRAHESRCQTTNDLRGLPMTSAQRSKGESPQNGGPRFAGGGHEDACYG